MKARKFLRSGRILNIVLTVVGVILLIALGFSLNALFSSRSQQAPQTDEQAQTVSHLETSTSQRSSPTSLVNKSQVDPTADWKNYADAEYDYTVKYPPTWSVSRISADPREKQRRVDLLSHPLEPGKEFPTMISITVYDNPEQISASQWVQADLRRLSEDQQENIKLSELSVADTQAIKAVGFPSAYGMMSVILTKNSYTYVFDLTPYDPTLNQSIMQERVDIFNLILSTFQAPTRS